MKTITSITEIGQKASDVIYSNFDHELNDGVKKELEKCSTIYSQHAAWDFCGYVWLKNKLWREEVWIYGAPVETMSNESLEYLISNVNDKYGSD